MPQENEHIKRMKDLEPNLKNIKVEFNEIPEFFDKLFTEMNKTKKSIPINKKNIITLLQSNYNEVVSCYIELFVKKHGYEFTDWVGDEVGEIACFIEQYFFNFSDIKFDIDNKIKKDLIFQYQDDCLAHPKKSMNFRSYASGLRFEDIKNKK